VSNAFDLRAYDLLLDDTRKQLNELLKPPLFEVMLEPTHRLDEFLSARIKALDALQLRLNYAAMKIKHLKEDIGTLPGGLPR
jgi:hypothetical protein